MGNGQNLFNFNFTLKMDRKVPDYCQVMRITSNFYIINIQDSQKEKSIINRAFINFKAYII